MSRMVKIALGQEPNGWPKEASPAEIWHYALDS
jgi:hypothetical protein